MQDLISFEVQFKHFLLLRGWKTTAGVQIMNLYWKESASLFQITGMSRLVCWMFHKNELFYVVFPCSVSLTFFRPITANGCHQKNCSNSTCFQRFGFALTNHKHETADIQNWLWSGVISPPTQTFLGVRFGINMWRTPKNVCVGG